MSKKIAIHEVYEEYRQTAKGCITVCRELEQLSDKGVLYLDEETLEPWLPDNVVLFPGTKEVH
jgi:hypothetical protein